MDEIPNRLFENFTSSTVVKKCLNRENIKDVLKRNSSPRVGPIIKQIYQRPKIKASNCTAPLKIPKIEDRLCMKTPPPEK